MENNFINNERKVELWQLMDKEYKAYVRRSRIADRKAVKEGHKYPHGYFWFGLCFVANELETDGQMNFTEYWYIKDTINKDLRLYRELQMTYDTDGKLDTEGRWMFAPTDCNSRYKYIKSKIQMLKILQDGSKS